MKPKQVIDRIRQTFKEGPKKSAPARNFRTGTAIDLDLKMKLPNPATHARLSL